MNILITGGSGFIGRNLTEFLSARYCLTAPSSKELDLTDQEAVDTYFEDKEFDFVIHCAVKPGHRNADDTSGQLYCNTRMFFNLVRNQTKFKHMFYLGSGLVYGLEHYKPKMKESYFGTFIPEDEGGFSKYIITKYIEKAENITELRVFGIFGKYEEYAIRFISNLICKAIFDLPLTVNRNRKFDYIHINDFCKIVEHFLDHVPAEKAINITPDESIELIELAQMIRKISSTDQPIVVGKDGMGPEYSGDNSLLKKLMPNFEYTPFEDSIRELYGWYIDNKNNIDKASLTIDK